MVETYLKGNCSNRQQQAWETNSDEYIVTMAVLTACLGKKVPISRGNITMPTMAQSMMAHASSAAPATADTGVETSARVDNVRFDLMI